MQLLLDYLWCDAIARQVVVPDIVHAGRMDLIVQLGVDIAEGFAIICFTSFISHINIPYRTYIFDILLIR